MGKRDLQKVGWCWLFDVVCASECVQCVQLLPLLQSWSCPETTSDLMDIMHLTITIAGKDFLYIITFLHWTYNYDTFTVSYTFIIYVHTLHKAHNQGKFPHISLSWICEPRFEAIQQLENDEYIELITQICNVNGYVTSRQGNARVIPLTSLQYFKLWNHGR